MKNVLVLYNSQVAAMMPWRGWRTDDIMDLVFVSDLSYDTEPDRAICEAVFSAFNNLGGTLRLRSMSVGDIVIIDLKAYACVDLGFEEVPMEAIIIRTVIQVIARKSKSEFPVN